MAGKSGISTVLALLGARGEVPGGAAGAAEDLFGEFEAQDAPQPLQPVARTGKPGRPVGARNKSTDEFVRYFLSRYRSPLTVAAEIYSRPLAELVAELQALADREPVITTDKDGRITRDVVRINPLDVLKLQLAAAQGVAPYIHKQQPKALEIDQRSAGVMLLGEIDGSEAVDDDLALPLPPTEENQ